MTAQTQARPKRWLSWLGYAWAALFSAVLIVCCLLCGEINWQGYGQFNWLFLLYNLPIVVATFLVTKGLMRLHRVFAWRPSDLFVKRQPGQPAGETLLVKAMKARWVGPVVTLLLLVNLPLLALLEEFIFRQGTVSWTEAVWRSALFGLAHLLCNVPLGASLAIGGVGLWFSWWYFQGGIMMSGAVHLAYILPIILLGSLGVAAYHLKRLKK